MICTAQPTGGKWLLHGSLGGRREIWSTDQGSPPGAPLRRSFAAVDRFFIENRHHAMFISSLPPHLTKSDPVLRRRSGCAPLAGEGGSEPPRTGCGLTRSAAAPNPPISAGQSSVRTRRPLPARRTGAGPVDRKRALPGPAERAQRPTDDCPEPAGERRVARGGSGERRASPKGRAGRPCGSPAGARSRAGREAGAPAFGRPPAPAPFGSASRGRAASSPGIPQAPRAR